MQQDPYNCPFPHRQDLMNLSTIKNQKRDLNYENRSQSTMTIQGIDGAAPKLKPYQYLNKVEFCNRDDDIPGAKSRPLIRISNRYDNQFMVDDIKGTRPKVNKFSTNRNPLNPLEPVYKIASYEEVEPLQPKFIRDSYNVQDIEGAQPSFINPKLKKQPIILEEVECSHPEQRFILKDYVDSLQVKDINNDLLHKYVRNNPIDPVYQHRDDEGQKISSNWLYRMKQKKIITSHFNKQICFFNSNNLRYCGCLSWISLLIFFENKLKQKIYNPLMPAYQMPGSSEIYSIKATSVFLKNASTQMLSNGQKMDQFLPQS